MLLVSAADAAASRFISISLSEIGSLYNAARWLQSKMEIVYLQQKRLQHGILDESVERHPNAASSHSRPAIVGSQKGTCLSWRGYFRSVEAVKGNRREPRSGLAP